MIEDLNLYGRTRTTTCNSSKIDTWVSLQFEDRNFDVLFIFIFRFPNFPPRRVWSSSPTALLKGIVHLGSGPLKAWTVSAACGVITSFGESSCRVNDRFSMIFTSLVTQLLSGKMGLVGENLCQNFWQTIEFEAWNVHHKHGHVLVESGGNFADVSEEDEIYGGWTVMIDLS